MAIAALGDRVAPRDRIRLRLLEGQVAILRPDFAAARVAARDAVELAEAAGDHALAGEANRALAHVLIQAMEDGEFPLVEQLLAAADRHFEIVGDARGRLGVAVNGLEVDYSQGRLTAVHERGMQIIEGALALGDRRLAAFTYSRLTAVAGWLGKAELGDELAEQAMTLAREQGLGATQRWTRFRQARLQWLRGDLNSVEAEMRSLVADAEAAGDGNLVLTALRLLGETLITAERFDEADTALLASLDVSVRVGDRWSRTELLAYRAFVRAHLGDLAEARRLLDESVATVRMDDVAAIGVIEQVEGYLAFAEGRLGDAEAFYRRALDRTRATEYCYWFVYALDLAEVLVTQGRFSEAASLVAEVDDATRAWGYDQPRKRIDALLVKLAGQPAEA
jgi:hypothetical protein